MTETANEKFVRTTFFEERRETAVQLAGEFVDDPVVVVDAAAALFEDMIPDLAYLDNPDHPMAASVFGCSANLAVYLALRERDVDVHAYGGAMLSRMAAAPLPAPEASDDDRTPRERFDEYIAISKSSEQQAAPGEFVYEAFYGDRETYDWGMNVKSCGICYQFSKYDAMDLVPYMCATDDVMSDLGHQGLRRTGTIAVGAHQCDFRYQRKGEPGHLADKYPDRIRILEAGDTQ
jgi:hypothetical protein